MKRFLPHLMIGLTLSAIAAAGIWWVVFYQPGDIHAELRRKAEAGHTESRYALAEIYRLGTGVDKDMLQAYQWHKKAALAGHVDSQYKLGMILEKGDGVRQNMAKAFEWYALAVKLEDHREAVFAMAQMYFHGRGVSQDYAEAFPLYKKAAFKGHRIAQHLLGAMYEEGWADRRDFVEAYMWYTLALPGRAAAIALNPLYDPRQALDRLTPRMTKFQVRRGKQRVRDWQLEHDDPFD